MMASYRFSALAFSLVFGLLPANEARADSFHYKNILIGERASGLGGAFTAISDDPSAVYYNPAGLVFANENYASLSAHAFSSSSQVYKDVWPGKDYTYSSSNLVPSFFGFTQSVGRHRIAFAVAVPQSDLIDQDDTLTDISLTTDKINTLKRRFFSQDTTYLIGPGFATEAFNNFTIGASVMVGIRTAKALDQQLGLFNPVGAGKYVNQTSNLTRNARGLLPKLGVQYMPMPKWSFGLTASRMFTLGGSGSYGAVVPKSEAGAPVTFNGSFEHDQTLMSGSNIFYDFQEPWKFEFGTAHFFSRSWLVAGDVSYATGDKGYLNYSLQPVLNWAVGTEYYLSEAFAVRGGVYSNNANSPNIVAGLTNQDPHVDQLGGTLGLSFYRPGTSLTLTTGYHRGTGRGQAIGDSTAIQEVRESGFMVTVAGSYQL